MGRTREFDMEEAIRAATKLFWHGYDKTSLVDLTETLGIGAASFYFAFESKEALFRQVVERYVARLDEALEGAFQASDTRLGVNALLRGYVDVVTSPEHTPGCLIVNNSPSLDADDTLRQWLAGHRETLRIKLEKRFTTDVADGQLPVHSDPKAIVRYVMTLAGGLAVEARAGASRQDLYAMLDFALKSFAERTNDNKSWCLK